MTDDPFLLVVGGARSGKSDFAIEAARRRRRPTTFVATAQAGDADMADRISRHQADRPSSWGLIEEPLALAKAVEAVPADHVIVLDCLTLWVANALFAERTESETVAEATEVARELGRREPLSVVVTNEVGLGIHPETSMGRHYRDRLGRVNAAVAAVADRTLFFAAGLAMPLADPFRLLSDGE
ncbi:MAG: bifunctional adenosylcobinamide kinase/adenosylcobinamide-phosphate guanylyltransferase [Actinomycetota bacterium]